MSWSIQNLSAVSNNQSLQLTWSYSDASQNPPPSRSQVTNLYVNYTDDDLPGQAVQTTSTAVIPLRDASGNLSTSFLLTGLINGVNYILNMEAIYTDPTLGAGQVTNSNTVTAMPSTIPPAPQTFYLTQNATGSFSVNLSLNNNSIVSPSPVSSFDGYSVLSRAYVAYNDGNNIVTTMFTNDASNSLYTRPLVISGLNIGSYEVSVKLSNVNGISQYSPSQVVAVEVPIPGAVQNLAANPRMFVDPSFNPYTNTPQIVLTWQPPAYFGDPSLNGYNVLRGNVVIATLTPDANHVLPTKYIDGSGVTLNAGTTYNYTIQSLSPYTAAGSAPNYASVSVVAVAPPTITSLQRTSGDSEFTIDVSYNANGFSQNQISFDISGNGGINTQNFTQEPFTVNNLLNGFTYSYQVRVKGQNDNLVFPSSYTAVSTATPYAPLLPLLNQNASNVDVSGNPLNGKINLSWTFPTLPDYQASVNTYAVIYRKLNSSPDASYAFITTIASPVSVYQDSGLVNGISYKYKLVTRQPNADVGGDIDSTPVYAGPVIPLNNPSAPTGLSFADASMAYAFTASANNGGLPLAGYQLTLTNVSNGTRSDQQQINLTARDGSGNLITNGNVLSYVLPGRNYELVAKAYVMNDNVAVYSAASVADYAFSTPEVLSAPVVFNVDGSGIPIGGANVGTSLLVNWAINAGYDASNATYSLYRNANPLPITDASNLSVTNYINNGLTNGQTYYYQVAMKLGSTVSPLSAVSNTITPFAFPSSAVTATFAVVNQNSVNLAWTQPSLIGTGLLPSNIYYRILDNNNNILFNDLSLNNQNITGLTPGVLYTYKIQLGVSNNGSIYYNNDASQTQSITVSTYDLPNGPQGLTAYPSNQSALIDVSNAVSVTGLTFQNYVYQYKVASAPDASYSVAVNQTQSLFYIMSLTNNVVYTVKLVLQYTDSNSNYVYSPPGYVNVMPQSAPNAPSGGQVISNQSSLQICWNPDVSPNAPTFYSIYKDNEILYSHLPATQGPVLQFSNSLQKWFITDNNVIAGEPYDYDIVGEKEVSGAVFVSSAALQILNAAAWAPPSQVQNLSYLPSNNQVNLSWQEPSDTAGANVGTNSQMLYEVTTTNPSTGLKVYLTPQNAPQSGLTLLMSGTLTDICGNPFNVTNNTTYTVSVVALFNVAGDPNNQARSAPSTLQVKPKAPQMTPILTANATNKGADGKQITLKLTIDPSSNPSNVNVNVSRSIRDVSNVLLSQINNQALSLVWDSSMSATIIDSPNSNIGNDVNNFLNGNIMSYQMTVTQNNWSINYNDVASSNTANATPSGQAIIQSMVFDASGNVKYVLNKNGAPVNSLVTIGFDLSGNTVQVIQQPANAFTFNNAQQNNNVAKNQLANFTQNSWTNSIEQALGIFSTQNSSALLDVPAGSIL